MDTFKRKKKKKAKIDDFEVLGDIQIDTVSNRCKKIRRKADGKVFMWNEISYRSLIAKEKQLLISELELLKRFQHENIIQVVDYIDHEESSSLYVIKEYFGNNLSLLLSRCKQETHRLEEAFIWKILHQLVKALEECHRFNENNYMLINHGFRPHYILLDSCWNVKFGDYALIHQRDVTSHRTGFSHYVPPEKIQMAECTEKSDVWSIGCLIYELCSLIPPFYGCNWFQLSVKIKGGHVPRIPWRYSDDLQETIRCMINVKEESRPTFHQLLAHPRLKENVQTFPPPILKKTSTSTMRKSQRLFHGPGSEHNPKPESSSSDKDTNIILQQGSEERPSNKLINFEAELARAEKVLEDLGRQTSRLQIPAVRARTKSLDRRSKDKRRVHYVFEKPQVDDKENEECTAAIVERSFALDFETRKSKLQQRLKNAQSKALELRTQEIQGRFFEHLAFL